LLIEYCNNNEQTTTKENYLIVIKILALLSVLILSSCGMQGDLYLPDENADNATQETNSK
jgi:predicted small lipoprotein YifL